MRKAQSTGQTHYVCLSAEHAGRGDLTHGHFTVKSGTWGYCASERPEPDHVWRAVDGILLGSPQELAYRMRALLAPQPLSGQEQAPAPAARI